MILTFSKLYEIFLSQIEFTDSCWLWKGNTNPQGYGQLYLPGLASMPAHRFSYELKNGKIRSSKILVCHTCDNPPCVRPSHLFEGTAADNTQDRLGKARYNGKLNNSDVRAIRWLFQHGMRKDQLTDIFEVNRHTIFQITTNRAWKHLLVDDSIQNVGSS
jgi:hypothetical protein